jgi:hypothetical protein
MTETDLDTYALRTTLAAGVAAPDLAYRPPVPRTYRPRIALSAPRDLGRASRSLSRVRV